MKVRSVAIIFSMFLVVVSSTFLSDGVLDVNFTKIQDEESNEYDFEYSLDAGKTFRGRTFILAPDTSYIYLMVGANDMLYWVELTEDEYENKEHFTKTVRLVERDEDKLYFRDEFTSYLLRISIDRLYITSYLTKWDLEKICFIKSDNENQTFNYTISATNNSRKFNGTTLNEMNDPHVQRIHLDDSNQFKAVYEVNFSNNEINSNETFCKGISKTISSELISTVIDTDRFLEMGAGVIPVANINPSLLKALVG